MKTILLSNVLRCTICYPLLLFSYASLATAVEPTFRTIATSRQPVPGIIGSSTFNNFQPPLTNRAGIAFRASFTFNESSGSQGVFYADDNRLDAVAIEKDFADDFVDLRFRDPWPTHVGGNGEVYFRAELTGSDAPRNGNGFWKSNLDGSFTTIAKSRDTVPGLSDFYFEAVEPGPVAPGGTTAGRGFLRNKIDQDQVASGIWLYQDGNLSIRVSTEGEIDGFPGEQFYAFRSVQLTSQGDVLFRAISSLKDSPDPASGPNDSIWRATRDGLDLMVRFGEPLPENGTLREVSAIRANDQSVAFLAEGSNGITVYHKTFAGELTKLFSRNDTVPIRNGVGTILKLPGTNFSNEVSSLRLGNDDSVLIRATFMDSQDPNHAGEALWLARPGKPLKYLAGVGDSIPGRDGMFIGSDDYSDQLFGRYAVSDNGTVAFVAHTAADFLRPGLWISGPDGDSPQLILLTGDEFTLPDGSTKIVRFVDFNDGEIDPVSTNSLFTENGEFAFTVAFEDGSHAVVAVTVPEPTNFVLVALFALLGIPCQRNRQ